MGIKGAGTHLHDLIKTFTGQDYTAGCGCKDMVKKMDANPPQWSLDNFREILTTMRGEARRRSWWTRIAVSLPGTKAPLKWFIREAVRRAEEDIAKASKEEKADAKD